MNSLNPKISIIMPIYNGQKYATECLESIAMQTFDDFECLIVDDGSTDSTIRIVDSFCATDTRFKIVETGHKGSSHARNVGFKDARGEFILFLDSDDFFHVDMLKIFHQEAVKNKTDITICSYRKFDTIAKEYSEKILSNPNAPRAVFNAEDIPDIIFNTFSGVVWNKLYRKNFLLKNDLTFAEDLVIGADSLFAFESLLRAKKMFYSGERLIDYRVNNPESDIGRARQYFSDISLTFDRLYAFVRKQKNSETFIRSLDNWVMKKCLWMYELDGDIIDPILGNILQKYELTRRPDDYYSPSSVRQKMIEAYHIRNVAVG